MSRAVDRTIHRPSRDYSAASHSIPGEKRGRERERRRRHKARVKGVQSTCVCGRVLLVPGWSLRLCGGIGMAGWIGRRRQRLGLLCHSRLGTLLVFARLHSPMSARISACRYGRDRSIQCDTLLTLLPTLLVPLATTRMVGQRKTGKNAPPEGGRR